MGKLAFRFVLVLSALSLAAGVVGLFARHAILDREAFADRAVATLAQDEVTDEIATRFTDQSIERSPGLVTLRPAIQAAAQEVAMSPWFTARFAAGMRALHDDVFARGSGRPSLHVPGMTAKVQDALSRRTPVLALRLPRDADPSLLSIGGTMRETAVVRVARRADGLAAVAAPALLLLGIAGLLLAALAAPDRRVAPWACALALACAGGALLTGWIAARTLTLERFDTGWGDAVVRTIWGAYLGDLRTWALGLAGAGIVLAAAARRGEVRLPALGNASSGLLGAGAIVAGGLLLADRELAFDLAAAIAGGLLLYAGACRLLQGPGRAPLAAAALLAIGAAVAVSSHGPAHTPTPQAQVTAALRVPAKPALTPARRDARARARGGPEQICFASVADARAAAETAAIPEGTVVKTLPDGRVCARPR